MILGITGNMGCGKSTAARCFLAHGFRGIDTDMIARDLLSSDPETLAAVGDRFGNELIGENGVDRKRLAAIAFADEDRLKTLESIMHPRIRARWENILAEAPGQDWIIEIPLLFEKNLENKVDFTVCVFCHPATQQQRLQARGLTVAESQARIKRQLPLPVKAEKADFVLLNDGELAFLEAQVERLVSNLRTPHTI